MADTQRESNRFWTVSNAFSLLRIALTPFSVWLIALGPSYVWEAFVVVAVMIASDILDGELARRRDEITRWGKILDPMADKIAIGAVTLALVMFKGVPWWLVVVVVIRDVLILLASTVLMRRCAIVPSSNLWGKLTTLVMSFLLLSYLLDLYVVQSATLIVATGLLCLSLVSYIRDFAKILRAS